jgi:hypothetical protein
MSNKKRRKVWESVPDVEVYRPNLEDFYKFMHERHTIWHRRFILREPPPWTENRILRDYKFTNIYRELDRGTLWYKSHVVPIAVGDPDLFWLTTMYRLLNKVETFEKVGLVHLADWQSEKKTWIRALKDLHKTESIFTSAHLTLPTHTVGKSKIDTYMEVLDELHRMMIGGNFYFVKVYHSPNLEELFNNLMEIPCVGRFISYEICCDLMLIGRVPFSENDWVNPGPGCRHGLKLIFPRCKTVEDFQDRIRQLAKEQGKHFKALKLKFPYLYEGKPLTLRSIEHSLCEYQKYKKMVTGIGKQRMHFRPQDRVNPQGQLPLFSGEAQ